MTQPCVESQLSFQTSYYKDCGYTTVFILVVWKANGFYARGSVNAFKIASLSKGRGSYNFMHSKQYKFCKISDWICTVKQTNCYGWFKIAKKN